MSIEMDFWIKFFKNRQIVDFKHKKSNYFQNNQKIKNYQNQIIHQNLQFKKLQQNQL